MIRLLNGMMREFTLNSPFVVLLHDFRLSNLPLFGSYVCVIFIDILNAKVTTVYRVEQDNYVLTERTLSCSKSLQTHAGHAGTTTTSSSFDLMLVLLLGSTIACLQLKGRTIRIYI